MTNQILRNVDIREIDFKDGKFYAHGLAIIAEGHNVPLTISSSGGTIELRPYAKDDTNSAQ